MGIRFSSSAICQKRQACIAVLCLLFCGWLPAQEWDSPGHAGGTAIINGTIQARARFDELPDKRRFVTRCQLFVETDATLDPVSVRAYVTTSALLSGRMRITFRGFAIEILPDSQAMRDLNASAAPGSETRYQSVTIWRLRPSLYLVLIEEPL